MLFDVCDLNFDMLSLVLELDLDITVTYFYAKNQIKRSFSSNVMVWKSRQMDRHV